MFVCVSVCVCACAYKIMHVQCLDVHCPERKNGSTTFDHLTRSKPQPGGPLISTHRHRWDPGVARAARRGHTDVKCAVLAACGWCLLRSLDNYVTLMA